jgi:small-conductance mechanosensitive channel
MFDQVYSNAIAFPQLLIMLPYLGVVDISIAFLAILTFVVVRTLFWVLQTVLLKYAQSLADKTNNKFDDVLIEAFSEVRTWVYSFIALYISFKFFTLPTTLDHVVSGLFYFSVVWQVIEILTKLLDHFATTLLKNREDEEGEIDLGAATASHFIALIVRAVLWLLGLVFVLSNLGIQVTSLLTGMGIGGVAIAFALQGVLGDLFASFSIYFDKPFRVGDFITIGTDSGTVEKIGIKTTRIRTLQGEELVVSNTELTTTRVQNFKKMQERRIVTQFGITYDTPQDRIKRIPEVVSQIFEQLSGVRLDRAHFATFGDSALIYEVVYYVESAVYNDYMNLQQEFNFKLLEQFAELGISFAYPTQTIYTKTIN